MGEPKAGGEGLRRNLVGQHAPVAKIGLTQSQLRPRVVTISVTISCDVRLSRNQHRSESTKWVLVELNIALVYWQLEVLVIDLGLRLSAVLNFGPRQDYMSSSTSTSALFTIWFLFHRVHSLFPQATLDAHDIFYLPMPLAFHWGLSYSHPWIGVIALQI